MKLFKISIAALVLFSFSTAYAQIDRFSKVADGVYRGSMLGTSEDLQFVKNLGVKTVIDFMTHDSDIDSERNGATQLGMEFHSIPLNSFFSPSDKDIDAAIKIMTDPKLLPVYVHCRHGKDRTGLVVGLYRVLIQHWDRDAAYKEMKAIGFSSILLGLDSYFWSRTSEDQSDD